MMKTLLNSLKYFLMYISIIPKLLFRTKTLDIPQILSNQIIFKLLNVKLQQNSGMYFYFILCCACSVQKIQSWITEICNINF